VRGDGALADVLGVVVGQAEHRSAAVPVAGHAEVAEPVGGCLAGHGVAVHAERPADGPHWLSQTAPVNAADVRKLSAMRMINWHWSM
jgi:hypothetical protein